MQLLNTFQEDVQRDLHIATRSVIDTSTFYGNPDERYLLDDYTRFTTMEDVMREYVKGVWVRKQNDNFHFFLPDVVHRTVTKNPLVTVDGLPVFNLDNVMKLDPLKIKRIDILSRKSFHGSVTFDGLIGFTSYKGDLAELSLDEKSHRQVYDGLQENREFYAPKYENNTIKNRIPDFRELLYWNPQVKTSNNGEAFVEFYTSEQEGNYFVVTQGTTTNGLVGSSITRLKVFEKP
jgi:hypothetical protein